MPEDDQDENPNPEQPPAEPSADPSAEERLKELQTQLQKKEKELADSIEAREADVSNKKSERDALKSAVESQTVLVDEIKKSSAGFGKGLEGLQQAEKDLADYLKKKDLMIDGVLGPEKKKKVSDKIKEIQDAITAQKTAVKEAEGEAETARTVAETAQTAVKSKQDNFNRYKQLASELAGNIQKMKGYRAKVEENDDPPRAASMFVYARELDTVLKVTKVATQAEFDQKLNQLWKELDTAKGNERDKKQLWEAAKRKLAAAQASLAALEKNEIDDKLKATNEFN
ncbi:MAG TPA: hypothetical protein VMS31_00530 [Pyrinomonadaceae bacterium]|nr:hypothetical protein [Pyrinomonadaceae bacterium]